MKPIHKKIKQLRINKLRSLLKDAQKTERDYNSMRVFIPSLNKICIHRLKTCRSAKGRRRIIRDISTYPDNKLLKLWSDFRNFINATKLSKKRNRSRLLPFATEKFMKL